MLRQLYLEGILIGVIVYFLPARAQRPGPTLGMTEESPVDVLNRMREHFTRRRE